MALKTSFKCILLSTAAAFLAGSASAALAQSRTDQADQPTGAASDDATKIDDIVVTGSNIRGVRSVGSPTTTIGREDIEASGLTTASQILSTLTQTQGNSNFSSEQPRQPNPYMGSNITGGVLFNNESRGNSVDIRGLGPNATLVLVDGRRQAPTGTVASFSEANILPLAAIDRIEVVTDGASAVYGSNAIGGVINYITRKDYEGTEISARYSTNHLYDEVGGSITAGKAWTLGGRPGNALITYDYSQRDNVSYGDDPRIGSNLTRYGGGDAIYSSYQQPAPTGLGYYSAQSCPPPRIFIPGFGLCFAPDFSSNGFVEQYYDVTSLTPGGAPVGVESTGPLPSNIMASTDALRDYTGKSETNAANLYLRQELTDSLSLFY